MRSIFVPLGGAWQLAELDVAIGNIRKFAGIFIQQVMVVRRIRVKIRTTRSDHDFAQQLRFRKLVERIVNGRQGDFDLGIDRFAMKLFGGDVPVILLKQELGERQLLASRAEPGWFQNGHERGRKVEQ